MISSLLNLESTRADSCVNPEPNTCDYYSQCLEKYLPCGAKGYALGYGKRYCHRFLRENRFSAQGEIWRNATLICLQRELAFRDWDSDPLTCREIKDFAFDSHPVCYTQPGVSVCELDVPDLKLILNTIDGPDFLSLRGLKQMKAVARICLKHLQRHPNSRSNLGDPSLDETIEERIRFWRSKL
jgi:hypothetical protein